MIRIEAYRVDDGIDIDYRLEGETADVLRELSCAAADVIIALAEDLHADDTLRESLATIVCADIMRRVCGEPASEREAEDKQEDA